MALRAYEENDIQAIADAIRAKNGSTATYTVAEMAAAIQALPDDRYHDAMATFYKDPREFVSGDVLAIEVPSGVTRLGAFRRYNQALTSGIKVKVWIPASVDTIVATSSNTPFLGYLAATSESTTYHRLQVFIEHAEKPSGWSSVWYLLGSSAYIPSADIHWGATYEDFANYSFAGASITSINPVLETMDTDPIEEVTI